MVRTEHRDNKFKFPFIKYAPANEREGLPMIILLHGAGERGEGGDDLGRVEDYGFIPKIRDGEYDCIFILPQCPTGDFWAARVESIIAFVSEVTEGFSADRSRVYLTGLSMGGFGTWYTAMAKPSIFAAIAPVCGGGMAWNAGRLDMPVWAFHGAADPTVSVTQSDEMVEALKRLGRDVRYTRLDGVGHNAWDPAYTDELISWLLEHKRA